jgi:hypothetical protein
VNPENNELRYFKNGIDQGVAYSGSKDVPIGVYFPAISLFGTAEITVNFGPSFILKHNIYGANGCSEAQPMNPDDRKVISLFVFVCVSPLAIRSMKPEYPRSNSDSLTWRVSTIPFYPLLLIRLRLIEEQTLPIDHFVKL